eukprot:8027671-Alexandrium_andersonii.AAC.1
MDHIGKAYLRLERMRWAPFVHRSLSTCQHGAGVFAGTLYASQVVREWRGCLSASGKSWGV